MKKTTLKIFSVILGIIIISFLLPAEAKASGLSVEFENDPLFNEANFLPGDSVTRWVKVTNNSGETQKVLTQATDFSNPIPSDDLCHALVIVIKKAGNPLYGPKSLCEFYQESNPNPVYLSDINNGETIQYDFSISFNSDSNNEWQGKTTYFDIVIGFGEEGEEPGDQGQGGGSTMTTMGGGGGGGYSGLIIFNEENQKISTDQVTVTWFTNHPATSRVIYDTVSHSTIGAPPNYGYAFSTPEQDTDPKVTFHSVTITGLTPGVTYYWRAVSHGSPEVWGKELSFTIPTRGEETTPSHEGGESTTTGETTEEGIARGPSGESGAGGGISAGGGTQPTGQETAPPQGGEGESITQSKEEQPSEEGVPKKGFASWLSSGLASIFDAFKNLFGKLSICQLIILILILIILYLLYLLYKKKKKEKTASKTINLGPLSSSQ